MKYVIYDQVHSEFLKTYNEKNVKKCNWSSCHNYGTELIKYDEDIPHVFANKREADKAIKLLRTLFGVAALKLVVCEEKTAVVIDWHDL